MSYTTTPLGLQLPVPGSGEAWSTSVYAQNLGKISTAIETLQSQVGAPTSALPSQNSGFTRQADTFIRKAPDGYVEAYLDYTGSFPNVVSRNVGTMPVGYRPTTPKAFPLSFIGGDVPDAGVVQIGVDGLITFITPAGSHNQAQGYIKFNSAT